MLRVEARVKHLFLLGGLTLAIGLAAVLAAVVYRVGKGSATFPTAVVGAPAVGSVAGTAALLPKGARLVGTTAVGERLALTYDVGGETLVLLVDAATGAVTGSVRIRQEP